jgi:threonine/homoserine/homoserine lactone efflux protein
MLSFLVASLLIELTPGPNMAWLAAVALSRGRRAALLAVAGVASGLAVLGLLAAAGLGAMVAASPVLYQAVRVSGFLFLLWLAWDTWRPPQADEGGFGSFRDGFVTNLLNPKAGLFYIAVLPAYIDPARPDVIRETLVLVAAYVLVATAIHASIVLFASTARAALIGDGRRIVAIRRILALGLVAVAIWFVWKT